MIICEIILLNVNRHSEVYHLWYKVLIYFQNISYGTNNKAEIILLFFSNGAPDTAIKNIMLSIAKFGIFGSYVFPLELYICSIIHHHYYIKLLEPRVQWTWLTVGCNKPLIYIWPSLNCHWNHCNHCVKFMSISMSVI